MAAHLSQGKQHWVLGPVGVAISDVIWTQPPIGRLVGEDIVHVLLYLQRGTTTSLVGSGRGMNGAMLPFQ